jgi:hypothetical protein
MVRVLSRYGSNSGVGGLKPSTAGNPMPPSPDPFQICGRRMKERETRTRGERRKSPLNLFLDLSLVVSRRRDNTLV